MNRKNQKMTTYFVILSLLIIGVIYAILQANLQINGIAKIGSNTWDIHFDNIQVNANSVPIGDNDSAATIDSENNCKVDFDVTLSTPGDFYEFTVDVVNVGSIDGMIGEIIHTLKVNNEVVSEAPDYLNYIVTYDDGDQIIQNHLLEAGDTLTYLVRLEFKTDIEELPDATTISSSFEAQYIQADSGAIKKLPYYACTYDGELVQGAEYTNGQYTYRYMLEAEYPGIWTSITTDGWGVQLSDHSLTKPVTSRLCTSINGKPIVSMANMFRSSPTTSIDTSSFDTSHVVNMYNMFNGTNNITNIEVSNFDTSNVINMGYMFYRCQKITSLDISNWDVGNVQNYEGAFGYTDIQTLDLAKWDVSNAVNMSSLFYFCDSLTSINMTGWEFNSIQTLHHMITGCPNLENLEITDWNFGNSNLSDTIDMFQSCSKLKTIDISRWTLNRNVSVARMFQNNSYIETVIMDNLVLNNNVLGNIFTNASCKKISAKNWVISASFTNEFFRTMGGGNKIEEIDVTGWDLSNTTSLEGLFAYNNSNGTGLKRIVGLNTWNTSTITNMSSMFQGLSSLQSLDLSSFNTSNVTNMNYMFQGCSALTTLDLSSFDMSNASSNISYMFNGCTSLTTMYARTQADADILNSDSGNPSNINFVVKV